MHGLLCKSCMDARPTHLLENPNLHLQIAGIVIFKNLVNILSCLLTAQASNGLDSNLHLPAIQGSGWSDYPCCLREVFNGETARRHDVAGGRHRP